MQDARGTSAKHGLSDAITRANLYTEVGADCALVEGPRSTYELQTIANHTTGFRAVSISEGGLTPSHSYQQLKEMGFNLVCLSVVELCDEWCPVVNTVWLMKALIATGASLGSSGISMCTSVSYLGYISVSTTTERTLGSMHNV